MLCKQYIEGKHLAEWTIPKIVQRMSEMRWLHDNGYKNELTKVRQQISSRGGYWDEEETRERAETRVLNKCGVNGGFPDVWPWNMV